MTPEQYIESIPESFRAADRENRPATLSESQRALATLIFRRFIEAGYPTRVAIAAVVNSYAEFDRLESFCDERGHKKSTLIARLIREHLDAERHQMQQALGFARTKEEG